MVLTIGVPANGESITVVRCHFTALAKGAYRGRCDHRADFGDRETGCSPNLGYVAVTINACTVLRCHYVQDLQRALTGYVVTAGLISETGRQEAVPHNSGLGYVAVTVNACKVLRCH